MPGQLAMKGRRQKEQNLEGRLNRRLLLFLFVLWLF